MSYSLFLYFLTHRGVRIPTFQFNFQDSIISAIDGVKEPPLKDNSLALDALRDEGVYAEALQHLVQNEVPALQIIVTFKDKVDRKIIEEIVDAAVQRPPGFFAESFRNRHKETKGEIAPTAFSFTSIEEFYNFITYCQINKLIPPSPRLAIELAAHAKAVANLIDKAPEIPFSSIVSPPHAARDSADTTRVVLGLRPHESLKLKGEPMTDETWAAINEAASKIRSDLTPRKRS